ncbi:MAG: hypothetical protein K6E94_00175 [Elusimicrobiaceae bacterium]|nr:hypothetical protein [Elusimicrobiaceae bacterium]
MKRFGKLSFIIALLFSIGAVVFAQDVQRDIEEMYKNRAIEDSRKEQMTQDSLFKEQVKEQVLIQRKKEKENSRQQKWLQMVGPGPVVLFDRKKVEKALEEFVNLNDVLDSWKPEQNSFDLDTSNIKCFTEPMYIPHTKDIQVKDPKNRKIHPDYQTIKGIDLPKPYYKPVLLLKLKSGKCVLVDSEYEAYYINCQGLIPYTPTSEERQKALMDFGFSKETIKKYAKDNPWNLVTYAACDNFDGHKLVEKVVMAWRYSSIANNLIDQISRKYRPNHLKQYRYVYIQKDGKEQEEDPKESEKLPKCFDLNRKKRKFLYKSDIQQPPPSYYVNPAILVWEKNVLHEGGGCVSWVEYYDDWTSVYSEKLVRESLLRVDEEWFF